MRSQEGSGAGGAVAPAEEENGACTPSGSSGDDGAEQQLHDEQQDARCEAGRSAAAPSSCPGARDRGQLCLAVVELDRDRVVGGWG